MAKFLTLTIPVIGILVAPCCSPCSIKKLILSRGTLKTDPGHVASGRYGDNEPPLCFITGIGREFR